jgi:hypothetical protein
MLIFLVGSMSGVIVGLGLCARYIRREIADDVGPKLKQVQLQLDTIQSELGLAVATRLSELSLRIEQPENQTQQPRPFARDGR